MRKLLLLSLTLLAPVAAAEAPVLTTRGRVDASHLALLAGPHTLGVGLLRASPGEPGRWPTALGAELLYSPGHGVVEARGAWQWQLGAGAGPLAASLQVGVTGYGVVRGAADVGGGPHVGLFAGLGGPRLEGVLGAQAGAESFLRTGGPRVPLRGVLGVRGRVGALGLSLSARGGVDVERGLSPTWRGELLLSVGWYGRD